MALIFSVSAVCAAILIFQLQGQTFSIISEPVTTLCLHALTAPGHFILSEMLPSLAKVGRTLFDRLLRNLHIQYKTYHGLVSAIDYVSYAIVRIAEDPIALRHYRRTTFEPKSKHPLFGLIS